MQSCTEEDTHHTGDVMNDENLQCDRNLSLEMRVLKAIQAKQKESSTETEPAAVISSMRQTSVPKKIKRMPRRANLKRKLASRTELALKMDLNVENTFVRVTALDDTAERWARKVDEQDDEDDFEYSDDEDIDHTVDDIEDDNIVAAPSFDNMEMAVSTFDGEARTMLVFGEYAFEVCVNGTIFGKYCSKHNVLS